MGCVSLRLHKKRKILPLFSRAQRGRGAWGKVGLVIKTQTLNPNFETQTPIET